MADSRQGYPPKRGSSSAAGGTFAEQCTSRVRSIGVGRSIDLAGQRFGIWPRGDLIYGPSGLRNPVPGKPAWQSQCDTLGNSPNVVRTTASHARGSAKVFALPVPWNAHCLRSCKLESTQTHGYVVWVIPAPELSRSQRKCHVVEMHRLLRFVSLGCSTEDNRPVGRSTAGCYTKQTA